MLCGSFIVGTAALLLSLGGCQSPSMPQANAQPVSTAPVASGSPMQDVVTEARAIELENQYNAEKNSRSPKTQAQADAIAAQNKRQAEEKAAEQQAAEEKAAQQPATTPAP